MATKMINYTEMTAKYSANVNVAVVDAITKYCGIALRSKDGRYVAASDKEETIRIVKGFCAKKLGLDTETASAAVAAVCLKMKSTRMKHRVPFYYLIAEHTGKFDALLARHERAFSANKKSDIQKVPAAANQTLAKPEAAIVAAPAYRQPQTNIEASATLLSDPVVTIAQFPTSVDVKLAALPITEFVVAPTRPTILAKADTAIAQIPPKIQISSISNVTTNTYDQAPTTVPLGFFSRLKSWFSSDSVNSNTRSN